MIEARCRWEEQDGSRMVREEWKMELDCQIGEIMGGVTERTINMIIREVGLCQSYNECQQSKEAVCRQSIDNRHPFNSLSLNFDLWVPNSNLCQLYTPDGGQGSGL